MITPTTPSVAKVAAKITHVQLGGDPAAFGPPVELEPWSRAAEYIDEDTNSVKENGDGQP